MNFAINTKYTIVHTVLRSLILTHFENWIQMLKESIVHCFHGSYTYIIYLILF